MGGCNQPEIQDTKLVKIKTFYKMATIREKKEVVAGALPKFDNFETLDLIGEGTFGKVYSVLNPISKSKRAIKAINADLVTEKEVQQEIRQLEQLQHINITKFYDCFQDKKNNTFNFMFELAEYGSLKDIIREGPSNGKIPETKLLDYARQIAKGLQYLHGKKIIHKDLKPSNILLTFDEKIKITDAGIGNIRDKVRKANELEAFDFRYQAPEFDSGNFDYRADLYSFGLILFELATFQQPMDLNFKDFALSCDKNEIPEDYLEKGTGKISSILDGLLTYKPEDRMQLDQVLRILSTISLDTKAAKLNKLKQRKNSMPVDLEDVQKARLNSSPKASSFHEDFFQSEVFRSSSLFSKKKSTKFIQMKRRETLEMESPTVAYLKRTKSSLRYHMQMELEKQTSTNLLHNDFKKLAERLIESGKYVEAVGVFEQAIVKEASDFRLYSGKKHAIEYVREPEKLIQNYDKTLHEKPELVMTFFHKAVTLRMLGRYKESLIEIDTAIEFMREFGPVHREKGVILHFLNRYQDALNSYQNAIDLDFRDSMSYSNLGALLNEMGRRDESLKSFRLSIEFDENNPITFNNMGIVLKDMGREREALEAYKKALELDPQYSMAYSNMGAILSDLGENNDALKAFKQAIAIDPENPPAYMNLSDMLDDLGKKEEALKAYKKALKLDPVNSRGYLRMANILKELGRKAEALNAYNKAIELDPSNQFAYNHLGLLINDVGDQPAPVRRAFNRAKTIK